ncbi:MAG: integrase arm-type DNA-binding domain-containing protein [Deltaproteobacteria bacterium]|nr:integrase arm-type DNA-binding domain-containing protein [Kofleriaceae bacterium]
MATIKLTEKSLEKFPLPVDVAQAYAWDTEVTGFGAVIGKTGVITFVARGRVAGKGERTKVKIGIAGRADGRTDNRVWNVGLARQAAKEILGSLAAGENPNAEKRARLDGPTLRDGLELHVSNMRADNCSQSSIDTITSEVEARLGRWLDRPLVELRGSDLRAIHAKITAEGKKHLANRIVRHVSAVWNTLDNASDDGLPGKNPARKVKRHAYVPRRKVIEDLPAWYAKVQTLSPVRRDLQLFALCTGMRDHAACHVRWEHVDLDRGLLFVPRPKGGEKRAFTLPLAPGVVRMLRARREENGILFAPYGGDHGWAFPSLSRKGAEVGSRTHGRDESAPIATVIPVAESKERRRDPATGKMALYLPGLHTLRRTFLTVATEIGISELDRHVLANHAFGTANVNATYIAQSLDHLAGCAARIEAALWDRMGAKPRAPTKGRRSRPGRARR